MLQKNPATAADAEGDSMINAQQDQALNPQPTGAQQDPEAVQAAQTLTQLTEEQQQEKIANDAHDAMYEAQRGRLAGQKAEPHTSASLEDLEWFVDKTFLDPDIVIPNDGNGAAEKKT